MTTHEFALKNALEILNSDGWAGRIVGDKIEMSFETVEASTIDVIRKLLPCWGVSVKRNEYTQGVKVVIHSTQF